MKMRLCGIMFLALIAAVIQPLCAAADSIRQPVFAMVPRSESGRHNTWSFSLLVDASNPAKPLALVLEELPGQSLKNTKYADVLNVQRDEKAQRKEVTRLDAKDFGKANLEVKKDNALKVALNPLGDDSYRMEVNLRVSADGHFLIGGKEQSKRDVIIRYDKESKTWGACAKTLEDIEGKKAVDNGCEPMSGLIFNVTGTGIYLIAGVLGSQAVMLMDRK